MGGTTEGKALSVRITIQGRLLTYLGIPLRVSLLECTHCAHSLKNELPLMRLRLGGAISGKKVVSWFLQSFYRSQKV